jgi:hypothetical protein
MSALLQRNLVLFALTVLLAACEGATGTNVPLTGGDVDTGQIGETSDDGAVDVLSDTVQGTDTVTYPDLSDTGPVDVSVDTQPYDAPPPDALACPADPFSEKCAIPGQKCEIGQECCCGQCYPSLVCTCGAAGQAWSCSNTDACMISSCPDVIGEVDTAGDTGPDASVDSSPDGGQTVQCGGENHFFPTFSDACTSDADCNIGLHQINCCGTKVAIGVTGGDYAAFEKAEATCSQQFPKCGCATFPTQAQDGFTAAMGNEGLGVRCMEGMCRTFVQGAQVDCADKEKGIPQPFKSCQDTSECVYVLHQTDCCGSEVAIGMSQGTAASYAAAEAKCSAGQPLCDCIPKPTTAEDGVSAGDGMLAVTCQSGLCYTYVKQ